MRALVVRGVAWCVSGLDVSAHVESVRERIGEDDAEGEDLLRAEWEAGDQDLVLGVLKAEVGGGRGGLRGSLRVRKRYLVNRMRGRCRTGLSPPGNDH